MEKRRSSRWSYPLEDGNLLFLHGETGVGKTTRLLRYLQLRESERASKRHLPMYLYFDVYGLNSNLHSNSHDLLRIGVNTSVAGVAATALIVAANVAQ